MQFLRAIEKLTRKACNFLGQGPYVYYWHAGQALTVKTSVLTSCTPLFPKNQHSKLPRGGRGSAAASPKHRSRCGLKRHDDECHLQSPNCCRARPQNYRDVTTSDAAVPETVRTMIEEAVDQSREVYDRSKDALDVSVTTLERTFDAAGQGAVAFNRKIIDIAQRNVNSGFDLAKSLAGAKNLSEVVELQAAYWQKLLGALTSQAEEVRALSTKLAAAAGEPLKEQQVKRGVDELRKAN